MRSLVPLQIPGPSARLPLDPNLAMLRTREEDKSLYALPPSLTNQHCLKGARGTPASWPRATTFRRSPKRNVVPMWPGLLNRDEKQTCLYGLLRKLLHYLDIGSPQVLDKPAISDFAIPQTESMCTNTGKTQSRLDMFYLQKIHSEVSSMGKSTVCSLLWHSKYIYIYTLQCIYIIVYIYMYIIYIYVYYIYVYYIYIYIYIHVYYIYVYYIYIYVLYIYICILYLYIYICILYIYVLYIYKNYIYMYYIYICIFRNIYKY